MPARKSDHRKSVGDAGTVAVATAAPAVATPDESAASQPRTSSPAAGPGAAATEKKDKEAKDKEHRDKDAVTIEVCRAPAPLLVLGREILMTVGNARTGPHVAEIYHNEAGKGGVASEHADPGQRHPRHEQERHRLHQLPRVPVSASSALVSPFFIEYGGEHQGYRGGRISS